MIDMRRQETQRMINDRGFSLIELMIAMVLFSIGMMGIANMLQTSTNGVNSGRHVTEANMLASDLMERLTMLSYDDTTDNSDPLDDVDADGTGQDADSDLVDDDGGNFGLDDATAATADHYITNGTYTVYWNIAVDHPAVNMKTIKIIVVWQAAFEGTQGQRSASFDFIRANM